jgi:hypothetical protein
MADKKPLILYGGEFEELKSTDVLMIPNGSLIDALGNSGLILDLNRIVPGYVLKSGETISQYNLISIDNNGYAVKASNTTVDNKYNVIGMYIGDGITGNGTDEIKIISCGSIDIIHALGCNKIIYLSDSGDITDIAPTSSGKVSLYLGFTTNVNSRIHLNIGEPYFIS